MKSRNKIAVCFLILLSLHFLSFQSIAQKENTEKYKKLIIDKWFAGRKTSFEREMSLKIEDIPVNQLKEINSSSFPLFDIKKIFVLDLADINFVKRRKVLVVSNKNKTYFLETEKDVFSFIKNNYTGKKYGFQFVFETLSFLKHARGYNLFITKNIRDLYDISHKEYPSLLKNPNVIITTGKDNTILCKSLFSTLNNNAVILIEIKMSPKSISVKKVKEEVFLHFI